MVEVEKRECLYTVDKKVNWWSHHETQYGCPQKLKIELPYYLPVLHLAVWVWEEMKSPSQRYPHHPHVHSSIIHSSQDMQTA